MNIYDLRKSITVLNWEKTPQGAYIVYKKNKFPYSINFTRDELFKELISIGTYEDNYHDATEFDESKCISQWDALNIAIRHELEKETEIELNDSDLFSAIAKITKPNK